MKTQIRIKPLLTCLLSISLFASCVVYQPHNVDIPLLEEKGDLRADAAISFTFPIIASPSLTASVAYAPLQHLGVQLAGDIIDGHNYFYQGAAGLLCHPSGASVLEAYFGAAHGHSLFESSGSATHTSSGGYNVFFNQLNFGWNQIGGHNVDFGLGLRTGILDPDFSYVRTDNSGSVTNNESFTSSCFLLEPRLVFRFGWEKVKFSLNLTYSFLNGWPTENDHFNYERLTVGMGVNYRF